MRIPPDASASVQQAFRDVQADLDRILGKNNLDFSGRRIINAGNPVDPQDYVTQKALKDAEAAISSKVVPQAIVASRQVILGTHAERLLAVPVVGTIWYETDRTVFYLAAADGWRYLTGIMSSVAGDVPVAPGGVDPGGSPAPPPPLGGGDPGTFVPPQVGAGDITIPGGGLLLKKSGVTWPWIGSTDFMLFKNWLDGGGSVGGGGAAAIGATVNQRITAGINLFRVLGMAQNIAVFHPSSYATYFSELTAFAGYLAFNGAYLEFVVFADAQSVMPVIANQITHFGLVVTALTGAPNVFIELVNEFPQNGVDPTQFSRPVGILSSNGSNLGGELPPVPPWDYCTYHSPRDAEWMRKGKDLQDVRDGYVGFSGMARPCISDEPMGADETDQPGRRSTEVDAFYWFAATCAMFGAGATFHSEAGITSNIWGPVQANCAAAFIQAMTDVGPNYQTGFTYTRGGLSDCPIQHDDAWALRTYAKYDAHNAVVVVVEAIDGTWPGPIPTGAWVVASETGPVRSSHGTLIFLTR